MYQCKHWYIQILSFLTGKTMQTNILPRAGKSCEISMVSQVLLFFWAFGKLFFRKFYAKTERSATCWMSRKDDFMANIREYKRNGKLGVSLFEF